MGLQITTYIVLFQDPQQIECLSSTIIRRTTFKTHLFNELMTYREMSGANIEVAYKTQKSP